MPFQLLPAEESDVSDMVTIFHQAFANDVVLGRAMCNVPTDIRRAFDIDFFTNFFTTEKINGAQIFKVVDIETTKMVGFAKWHYPHRSNEEQHQAIAARLGPYPEGTDKPLLDDFYRQLWVNREKWIDNEKTFFLHLLAVSPSHHRRGIGTMLIAHGLTAADTAGAPTYVEASSVGLPLYVRHGWKPVDDIRVNLDAYGYEGEGWVTEKCLIREPGAGVVIGDVIGE